MGILYIQVEQVISKRREVFGTVVGNHFVAVSPFQNPPWIVDRSDESIQFRLPGILPGRVFSALGRLDLKEEGVRTRAIARLDVTGLLLSSYAFHWLLFLGLVVFQGLWAVVVDPDIAHVLEDWIIGFLIIWPGVFFLMMRYRQAQRLKTYVHNLVFYA